MSRLTLLSYATPEFAEQQRRLAASALAAGFDGAMALSPGDIAETPFWGANAAVLAQPRGAGYWLWKPYLLLEQVRRLGADETLIYCDAGRDGYYQFSRRPEALVRLAQESCGFLTGVAVPQHGPLRRWTKRDCLILMGADSDEMHARAPVQATWSVWTNTPRAIGFLERWLELASDPRCLTDMPSTLGAEHPDFVDHRHDQAISTILTYQTGAPCLDLTHTGIYRLLGLRPQSRLAHRFLKRPQHADALLSGQPAWLALGLGQLRLWG